MIRERIQQALANSDLGRKILWTLGLLAICRIGVFVPVPGINGDLALALFQQATRGGQNIFQLMDIFSGGAFAQMTVFALGIMPYITASIFVQVMTILFPSLQKEMRENPEVGRRKTGRWTRLITVGMALFQSALYAFYTYHRNQMAPGIILDQLLSFQVMGLPWLYYLTVMTAMTAGTTVLMWLGEQITEKGIGNGTSLIITLGILSSLPSVIGNIVSKLSLDTQDAGSLSLISLALLLGVFVLVIVGTILVIQGERRVPLQYARRTQGRHEVQASGAPYIPLKVNYAGVIPVIFASVFLNLPATIAQFLGGYGSGTFWKLFTPGQPLYIAMYMALIFLFTFFWTSTQFNPQQIASDMKRSAAFIPGIRQGQPTQKYLKTTMSYITLLGACSLVAIAILPMALSRLLHIDSQITYFFGGTSLLILVGVILDTARQVATHLLSHRYEGVMRGPKMRGLRAR